MTIQEVLTKASEGGYHHDSQRQALNIRVGVLGSHALRTIRVDDIFLDPHFWRALGRTLGCERVWKGQWQRFLDHLAQGNTPESFFATLLSHLRCRIGSSIQPNADPSKYIDGNIVTST